MGCCAGGLRLIADGDDEDPAIEVTRRGGSTCTLTFDLDRIVTTCGHMVIDEAHPRNPPVPARPPSPMAPIRPPPPSAPPTCSTLRVSVFTAGSMHEAATEHGGHRSTTIDPVEAFHGEMVLWASPNAGDIIYRLQYDMPVSLNGLSVDYDAGATVRLQTGSGDVIASADCYESNGGQVNTCSLLGAPTTGTFFYVVIDSRHSTWNYMGGAAATPNPNHHPSPINPDPGH